MLTRVHFERGGALGGILCMAMALMAAASASAAVSTRLVAAGTSANTATIVAGGSVTIEVHVDASDVQTVGTSFRLSQTTPAASGLFRITAFSRSGSPFADALSGASAATIFGAPGNQLRPDNAVNLGDNSVGMAAVAPASDLLIATITLASDAATPAGTYRIQPTASVSFVTEVSSDPNGADVAMDTASFDIVVTRSTPGAPGPPVDVTATAGDGSITVFFNSPYGDGGLPVTGYLVVCGGNANSGSTSPLVVSGLTNGMTYTCTVTASNNAGIGTQSAPSNAVTPGPMVAITTISNPAAGGSVSCSPNPVLSGGAVSCNAMPAPGYLFTSFSGGCTGAFCNLSNVTSATSVTGNFAMQSFAITTFASPRAGGWVLCSTNPVAFGQSSTCTPITTTGYTFTGFGGDCAGTTCDLVGVSGDHRVLAYFAMNTYTIATATLPANGGTVTCSPNPVTYGSSATCAAIPAPGYAFSGFSGDCSGAACTFDSVTTTKSVAASFSFTASLDVNLSGAPTQYHAPTDGLMIIRYMLQVPANVLTAGISVPGAVRSSGSEIVAYLDSIQPLLDVDDDGWVDASTDGVMILRYMLGVRGNALVAGALAQGAMRTLPADVEAWLARLMR